VAPDDAYRAQIDRELCLGTSACEAAAPDHFVLNERGQAEYHASAGPISKERLLQIAHACPQGAIRIVDATGAPVEG
jgi:ferredoxin